MQKVQLKILLAPGDASQSIASSSFVDGNPVPFET